MKTSLDIIKYMYPTFGVAYHILMCKTNYRVSIHRSLRTKALINIKVTKLYAYFVQYLGSITLTRASKKMQKSKQEQQQLASHQCDRDSVMWSHISPAPRLRRARMAAPERRPRRLRDCATARATLLLPPSHARACAYGSQLPTSTSNFGFANCYILYSVPTIYKISFRFQDIGLGYIYILADSGFFKNFLYRGGVKSTVSWVFEDLKFKTPILVRAF